MSNGHVAYDYNVRDFCLRCVLRCFFLSIVVGDAVATRYRRGANVQGFLYRNVRSLILVLMSYGLLALGFVRWGRVGLTRVANIRLVVG